MLGKIAVDISTANSNDISNHQAQQDMSMYKWDYVLLRDKLNIVHYFLFSSLWIIISCWILSNFPTFC